jgi:MFS family permease
MVNCRRLRNENRSFEKTSLAVPVRFRFPLTKTFTALKYPNYRLWFAGQIVSLFGTWMQSTAQQFLVYELTGSAAYLGLVAAASGLPSWLLMLVGGVVADRIPRRKLLIVTQSAMMLEGFILSILTFTGVIQPWHIVLLAFGLGVANAFDAPARLALAPELVDRKDLINAIALNGTMFNTAVILGPTVGSLIYAAYGPGWCFLLNGLSYVAVIAALARMRIPPIANQPPKHASALSEILDGLRYAIAEPVIRVLIFMISVFSLFGASYVTLMPPWAVNVLGGDEITNGLLQSARGVGALVGALSLASLGHINYRGKLLSAGLFIFPITLLAFTFVTWLPLSLLLLTGVGAANVFIMNVANTMIQTNSPDEVRGRVNSIYSMTFFGFVPIGSFLIGQVAERTSEPLALQLGALLVLACALFLFFFVPNLRRQE